MNDAGTQTNDTESSQDVPGESPGSESGSQTKPVESGPDKILTNHSSPEPESGEKTSSGSDDEKMDPTDKDKNSSSTSDAEAMKNVTTESNASNPENSTKSSDKNSTDNYSSTISEEYIASESENTAVPNNGSGQEDYVTGEEGIIRTTLKPNNETGGAKYPVPWWVNEDEKYDNSNGIRASLELTVAIAIAAVYHSSRIMPIIG
ncbi:clumping factor B-like [Symsagittifera roscoffensis]|uniref:clumping factor B-like n=1 Tax=Symsagittifera roscoffensis TaxID=84072 RepID=UPI00307B2A02